MTRNAPIISLDAIHLTAPSRAGEVSILDGMSLSINKGETVAMLGPSGAGKTTAMMVMAGLEAVSSGEVRVAEHLLNEMDEDSLARLRQEQIGIVFQAFRLIPSMTALENVAIPLELEGASDAFAKARLALGEVGLGERLQHFPDQLSGGEQQRVAIARAMVVSPQILLADEPTGNLDQTTGEEIIDLLLRSAAKHRSAFVLITHDERLAKKCARIIRIKDGRVTHDSKGAR